MKFDIKKIFTPKVLTGMAVVGVVVTAVVAVHEAKEAQKEATNEKLVKANMKIDDEEEETGAKAIITKGVNTAWQYKGTIAVGTATIGCIIASHKLSMKEIAALTATCGYLAKNRDKLETEIKKLPGGEEALKVVKKELMEEQVVKALDEEPKFKKPWVFQSVEDTGNGDLLCYDMWGGRLFRSSLDAVEQAQARFNDMRDEDGFDCQLTNGDYKSYPASLSMNDLYNEYGMLRTQLGHQYGWPADDDYYPTRRIKFINTMIKVDDLDDDTKRQFNEDILVVEIGEDYYPMECWMEL